MKTQDYIVMEAYQYIKAGSQGSLATLEVGTFVKPIEPRYLPSHIKDTMDYLQFDPSIHCFVYCSHGIIRIAKKIMRKV